MSQTRKSSKVSLTQQAARKLKEIRQKQEGRQWGLRFADQRGFCGEGYEYVIDFADKPQPDDAVFSSYGVSIFVPQESLPRLQGSKIEYHSEMAVDNRLSALEKLGFAVSNPNQKGPCPCACNRGFDA